jgi:hypothetical protein
VPPSGAGSGRAQRMRHRVPAARANRDTPTLSRRRPRYRDRVKRYVVIVFPSCAVTTIGTVRVPPVNETLQGVPGLTGMPSMTKDCTRVEAGLADTVIGPWALTLAR